MATSHVKPTSRETPQAADINTAAFQLENASTRITKLSEMTNLVAKLTMAGLEMPAAPNLMIKPTLVTIAETAPKLTVS